MSAYAALKDNSSIRSIFHESGDAYEEDAEDEVHYQANSSGEDSDFGEDRIPVQSISNSHCPREMGPPKTITWSKFILTEENTVFGENYVIFGLKTGEYLVLNGQCNVTIQKGAVLFNQIHYIASNPYRSFNIVGLQSQSLPIISSTERSNTSDKSLDTKTVENEDLFTNEFKSVIKIENLSTGLENIGKYHPPFKGLLFGNENDEDIISEDERMFQKYSFEIVLREKGVSALCVSKIWSDKALELSTLASRLGSIANSTMIIGNKNSGKSTFSKVLLNSYLLSNESSPVCYLDIDPGQSEFSPPYSISLRLVSEINFGSWFPSGSTQDCHDHYFGFTSPVHLPNRYLEIIENLLRCYETRYKPKGHHLIINTPGWIKGYGKELLTIITEKINPDTLILLSSSLDLEGEDNSDILQNLRFKSLTLLPGIYQVSKYSPSQTRVLNKLLYFHQNSPGMFDFQSHLLDKSPLKLSYETEGVNQSTFKGINAVSVLNHSVGVNFNYEDVLTLIESTLMGVYCVKEEVYETIRGSLHSKEYHQNHPYYLDPSRLLDLLSCTPHDNSNVTFMGLVMLHSLNTAQKYMNIYLPRNMLKQFQQKLQSNFKMILIRGEGDLPSAEIFHPELVSKALNSNKQEHLSKAQTIYPYVSFERKPKLGGVWKARRNVMRRGHKHA
ncbi:Polynucleotide 5'-hydroxyl-kinase GRC3 [Spathaspora sp. JA1]|nr:Polynucleotide 5'-hydroxyl-kinase GRC3 [Spathaspora sp. JA1]